MDPLDSRSPDEFLSVAGYGEDEFIIEKSRFIGYTRPVSDAQEAHDFIVMIKELHPPSTHVCSAYIVGAGGTNMRFSDDGEPSGTAGVPMLEVLKKCGVTDTVVAVVRYFGGVKLGAGGLVRAYTQGCKIALDAATITKWTRHKKLTASMDYTFQGTVTFELAKTDWLLDNTRYDDKVHFDLFIPSDEVDIAAAAFANWTSGQAVLDWGDVCYKGRKS